MRFASRSSTSRSIVMRGLLSVAALALGAAAWVWPAYAAEPGMRVDDAWARRAPMMSGDKGGAGGNSAVYARITNAGTAADALVSAHSDSAAATEIHESYRDMGMMMMRPVKKIDLPAGGHVEMKPGGYHVMLLGVKRDLKPGEMVDVTLEFQRAGKIQVRAAVK
jgi:copper(I)-binding protein